MVSVAPLGEINPSGEQRAAEWGGEWGFRGGERHGGFREVALEFQRVAGGRGCGNERGELPRRRDDSRRAPRINGHIGNAAAKWSWMRRGKAAAPRKKTGEDPVARSSPTCELPGARSGARTLRHQDGKRVRVKTAASKYLGKDQRAFDRTAQRAAMVLSCPLGVASSDLMMSSNCCSGTEPFKNRPLMKKAGVPVTPAFWPASISCWIAAL